MNVYDYPKELNAALVYKREGKTFEQYESAAQDHLQPIECQIFWLLAEDVMDIVAEEVNKETAELNKMLGEKDRKLVKQKEMLNKYYGSLAGEPDVEAHDSIIERVIFRVEDASREYEAVSEKKIRGLDVTIQKNQTLGNWFIITDLDTGSRRVHRLKDVVSWTELRRSVIKVEEEKFDPDKRIPYSCPELDYVIASDDDCEGE